MNAGNTSDIPWPGPMIHHVRVSRITASPLPIFQALFLQPPTLPSSPAASLLFILTALKLLQKGIRSLLFCLRFKEQQQQQVCDRCDHEALINYRCLAQSSCPRLSWISRCPCSCVLWLLPVSDQGWGWHSSKRQQPFDLLLGPIDQHLEDRPSRPYTQPPSPVCLR